MSETRLTRRHALGLAATCALGSVGTPAWAQASTKINIGYTATLGFATAFVAKDQGFFAKRGLDVDFTLIALNSNIPAALLSDSVQVGGPTPSILLQAIEGGLDLVAIAGCSGVDPANTHEGVMVREDSPIRQPSDFIGKTVGVPGFNAFLHVLCRKWMMDKGVDYTKVNFVETPFTASVDLLRSGNVDAVITGDPYASRILAAGGRVAAPIYTAAPVGTPGIVYAATRAWAESNGAAIKAFRACISQGKDLADTNIASAKASAGKYVKLPADVLAAVSFPVMQTDISAPQLQFWVDVMLQQKMLQTKLDVSRLIVT